MPTIHLILLPFCVGLIFSWKGSTLQLEENVRVGMLLLCVSTDRKSSIEAPLPSYWVLFWLLLLDTIFLSTLKAFQLILWWLFASIWIFLLIVAQWSICSLIWLLRLPVFMPFYFFLWVFYLLTAPLRPSFAPNRRCAPVMLRFQTLAAWFPFLPVQVIFSI